MNRPNPFRAMHGALAALAAISARPPDFPERRSAEPRRPPARPKDPKGRARRKDRRAARRRNRS